MNETPPAAGVPATWNLFVRSLLTTGQNRLELLAVEAQEERERWLRAFLLSLGLAVFTLLAGIILSVVAVVLLWPWSPLGVLLSLAGVYALGGLGCGLRLRQGFRKLEMFPDSLDQLRKDTECLEKILA